MEPRCISRPLRAREACPWLSSDTGRQMATPRHSKRVSNRRGVLPVYSRGAILKPHASVFFLLAPFAPFFLCLSLTLCSLYPLSLSLLPSAIVPVAVPCSPGHFLDNTMKHCVPCLAGSASSAFSFASSCSPCAFGSVQPHTGASQCVKCVLTDDEYQDMEGQTQCKVRYLLRTHCVCMIMCNVNDLAERPGC